MCKPNPCGSLRPIPVNPDQATLWRLFERYLVAPAPIVQDLIEDGVELLEVAFFRNKAHPIFRIHHADRSYIVLSRYYAETDTFAIGESAFLTCTMYECQPLTLLATAYGALLQAQPDL